MDAPDDTLAAGLAFLVGKETRMEEGQRKALAAVQGLPESERAEVVAHATKEMSQEGQKTVAEGIEKSIWPQDSMHRMVTILGGVLAAIVLYVLAAVFSGDGGKPDFVTSAMVAGGSAMIGGVWGATRLGK
jgi:hypothetical protein